MSAWAKQRPEQVKKLGAEKASWYCFWHEPDGALRKKSCGPGSKGKRIAERLADKTKAKILTGTYERDVKMSWGEFRELYETRILSGMKIKSANQIRYTFDHFERLCKPKRIKGISNIMIADFIAKRRRDRGRNPGSKVVPSTINRDLANLRAVLRKAVRWGILTKMPDIDFEKEPKRLPNYATPEDFAAMYQACDIATKPNDTPYEAGEWWKGLLVAAQMTGWRIGELLALKWKDVDLEEGTAMTRHLDNKGGRDEFVHLHSVVIDHLKRIPSFEPAVFPWEKSSRVLYGQFAKIQDAAGIWFPCPDADDPRHGQCTRSCHRYGFHDERRAFATLNAGNMTREALQTLMRHRDANTTDRYINYARQVKPAVANLHVPEFLIADSV